MRDINRIDNFMEEITKVWKQNPDLRFSQLILNLKPQYWWEENEFLEVFNKIYNKKLDK